MPFDVTIAIETERLRLRQPSREDIGSIAALASDWEVAKQTQRIPHPYSALDAEQWIDSVMADESTEIDLIVTLVARQSVIGAIGLAPTRFGEGSELGFWIGKPYWGQGYATEAAIGLVEYAFGELGLAQIVAGAFPENRASCRVLEKVGFEKTEFAAVNWPHRGGHRRIQRYVLLPEKLRALR